MRVIQFFNSSNSDGELPKWVDVLFFNKVIFWIIDDSYSQFVLLLWTAMEMLHATPFQLPPFHYLQTVDGMLRVVQKVQELLYKFSACIHIWTMSWILIGLKRHIEYIWSQFFSLNKKKMKKKKSKAIPRRENRLSFQNIHRLSRHNPSKK